MGIVGATQLSVEGGPLRILQAKTDLLPFSPKKGRESHACEIYAEHSSHPRWNVCSSILIPPSQHQSIMVLPSITIFQLPQSVSWFQNVSPKVIVFCK